MTAYLIKRDGDDVVGYTTDSDLAERIDGIEAYHDTHDYHEYETEEVSNGDVF